MHCLISPSSRCWVCVLSGSVRGRISELMLSKGARIFRREKFVRVSQKKLAGEFHCPGASSAQDQTPSINPGQQRCNSSLSEGRSVMHTDYVIFFLIALFAIVGAGLFRVGLMNFKVNRQKRPQRVAVYRSRYCLRYCSSADLNVERSEDGRLSLRESAIRKRILTEG
jgi:hypothetical protein